MLRSGLSSILPAFAPNVRAAFDAGRLTYNGACFFQAVCWRSPTNIGEVLQVLGAYGLTEEEVRAGCAEALLAGVVKTDGSDMRPGDAAFYWPVRRAGD